MPDRERVGREASPSAPAIDTQSLKTTKAGGSCADDSGMRMMGRKRPAIVDAGSCALTLQIHPAIVQDRDRAVLLLKASRRSFSLIQPVRADTTQRPNGSGTRLAVLSRLSGKSKAKPDWRSIHADSEPPRRTRMGPARTRVCIVDPFALLYELLVRPDSK